MTGQERNYDEVLSRVLHSTTDRIEPVGDGLTKIQARLAEPWLKRQWWLLRSETTAIGWVLAVRCQSWFHAIRSGSAAGAIGGGSGARASAKRPRHASSPPRISVGQAMAWLRPALAVAGAVVLVVAGVFAIGGLHGTLFGSYANSNAPGTVSSGDGGGPVSPYGSGTPAGSSTASATQASATLTKPSSTPSDKVVLPPLALPPSSPTPTPPSSPTPSPTSASPTPTPSPSPTTTTTPTPTPSPTTSPPTPGTNLPMTSGPTVG